MRVAQKTAVGKGMNKVNSMEGYLGAPVGLLIYMCCLARTFGGLVSGNPYLSAEGSM